MSRFKVGDRVRCIRADVRGRLRLGSVYDIAGVTGSYLHLVASDGSVLAGWGASRFELVSSSPPTPVYEHEGRRYQEAHSGVAAYAATVHVIGAIVEAGDLVIVAKPAQLTRDEIVDRATKVLRARLAATFPLRAWEDDTIDAAVRSVVDDVMGEQP